MSTIPHQIHPDTSADTPEGRQTSIEIDSHASGNELTRRVADTRAPGGADAPPERPTSVREKSAGQARRGLPPPSREATRRSPADPLHQAEPPSRVIEAGRDRCRPCAPGTGHGTNRATSAGSDRPTSSRRGAPRRDRDRRSKQGPPTLPVSLPRDERRGAPSSDSSCEASAATHARPTTSIEARTSAATEPGRFGIHTSTQVARASSTSTSPPPEFRRTSPTPALSSANGSRRVSPDGSQARPPARSAGIGEP